MIAHKSSSQSAFISIFYDIGSFLGAILAGYASDKSGTSSLTCISMFIINIPVVSFLFLPHLIFQKLSVKSLKLLSYKN